MTAGKRQEFERVEVASRSEWRGWLELHHKQKQSIWLVTYKKAAGDRHLPYKHIVEEALCYGWIDSLPRKLDDMRTMLLISPRKKGSAWSKVNKESAARLIADGLMTAAGQAKIDDAKADGSWAKLDDVDNLVVPQDLAEAFDPLPEALSNFEAFPPSTRRGILEWVIQAKRPDTRAKRIAETVDLASRNIRANQFPKKP